MVGGEQELNVQKEEVSEEASNRNRNRGDALK